MKTFITLFCLALLAVAGNASAQWDTAGQLALLNRNKAELAGWDHWYSAAAISATAGRYWTPHIKTEFEIGTATEGNINGSEAVVVPGLPFPYQRYRDHRLRETTIGAAAVYQFFENQWVHPFIGGGVELTRERHTSGAGRPEVIGGPTGQPPLRLPTLQPIDVVTYSVRPVVTGGFKFYVSPHAFVRTEVRTSLAMDRPLALQWRGGIGFDF